MKTVAIVVMLLIGCAAVQESPSRPPCTKHCTTGKACGDSCIARDLSCTKPPGFACDVE